MDQLNNNSRRSFLKASSMQDRVNVSKFSHAVLVDIFHPAPPVSIAAPRTTTLCLCSQTSKAPVRNPSKTRENNLKPIQDYESNPVYCG
jgi:hypothetical protein